MGAPLQSACSPRRVLGGEAGCELGVGERGGRMCLGGGERAHGEKSGLSGQRGRVCAGRTRPLVVSRPHVPERVVPERRPNVSPKREEATEHRPLRCRGSPNVLGGADSSQRSRPASAADETEHTPPPPPVGGQHPAAAGWVARKPGVPVCPSLASRRRHHSARVFCAEAVRLRVPGWVRGGRRREGSRDQTGEPSSWPVAAGNGCGTALASAVHRTAAWEGVPRSGPAPGVR